jgi:hypothetical protein
MWDSEAMKPAYLELVRRACTEPQMFSVFKALPVFQAVVGRHELDFCLKCYQDIKEVPEVFENLSKFMVQDSIGSPQLSLVQHKGKKIDGNTLRYVQTVAKLHQTFGSLNYKQVFEWGSCYGGLSYCIFKQWPDVVAYMPHDLPELLHLHGLYFQALNMDAGKIVLTPLISPPSTIPIIPKIDLFISELALTEQDDETLYSEYEKYGKNANGLFMRVNIVDPARRNKFLEFVANDFPKLEVEEESQSRQHNLIVIGVK